MHVVPTRAGRSLLLPVALLPVVACGDGPGASECEALVEGARVVRSVGPGRWERAGLDPGLVELWRRGGTNEGEELAFPIFPAASLEGWLAIPDFQLGEVIVIAPDGTWHGAWTRQGSGPGEIATPVAVAWSADETLSVFDIARASVVRLHDGVPVGEDTRIEPTFVAPVLRAGELAWAGVHPDGTVLLDPALSPVGPYEDRSSRSALIVRSEPGGGRIDTVARSTLPTVATDRAGERPVPGWPRPVAATGVDGALAWGGVDGTYRVIVERAAGEPLQICRIAEPLPLTRAERGDSVPEGAEALAAAIRGAERPGRPAPFGRLVLGARGRVWVQRERPSPFRGGSGPWGEAGGRYDVFDRDGRYLGELRMPPRTTLQAARGDTIWTFESGELDETWVVAYRLGGAPHDDLGPGPGRR